MVKTMVLSFAVCVPKFTKFGWHVWEWSQFATPFSERWYRDILFQRYLQ